MGKTIPLPTMEETKHPELVKQAQAYSETRDKFLAAQRKFKTEKDALIMLMRQAGIPIYRDIEDDLLIVLESNDNIKVKKLSAAEEQ